MANESAPTLKYGPVVLQTVLNGRVLAEETYETIDELIKFKNARESKF